MNRINVYKIIFVGIILVAIALRFWNLGVVPPSPDWDEAALGYNAYSILHTGHDEYGKFLPVVLRSFDDYKPALYMYLIIPFIYIFDLSLVAVRMPAAVFGVIGVIMTYLLVFELTKKKSLALVTMGMMAISPWAIQFSRVGFETQIAADFNIIMVYLFVKGLQKNYLLPLSAIFGVLTIYIYQSEKVFMPLLILLLIGVYWKQIWQTSKMWLGVTAVVGAFVALPMLSYIVTNKAALTRATSTVAFSDTSEYLKKNVARLVYDKQIHDPLGLVFDNRRIEFAKTILYGYIVHFDLNWLFVRGDLTRHHVPGMAIMYLWEAPFVLLGIYLLLFSTEFDRKTKWLIFGWFLLAPIPASVTSGVPHAVRTMNFLPTYQLFSSIGLLAAYVFVSRAKVGALAKYSTYALFGVIVGFSFLFYLNQYFVQQNYFYSKDWQYGYAQVVPYVSSMSGNYKKVIVTTKEPMDQSFMFFLFYLKYPPQKYQDEGNASGGFREVHHFSNYEFRDFNFSTESHDQVLYVGRPQDIPDTAHVLRTFTYLNGEKSIVVAQ
jgi:4-amino-4-deoxy-L-arabinose transferase-like glycosyltransferase